MSGKSRITEGDGAAICGARPPQPMLERALGRVGGPAPALPERWRKGHGLP